MKFILFLVALGGTYAIAHAAGASVGLASGLAWAVGLVGVAAFYFARSPT